MHCGREMGLIGPLCKTEEKREGCPLSPSPLLAGNGFCRPGVRVKPISCPLSKAQGFSILQEMNLFQLMTKEALLDYGMRMLI